MRDLMLIIGCLKVMDTKRLKQLTLDTASGVEKIGSEMVDMMRETEKTLHQAANTFTHAYQSLPDEMDTASSLSPSVAGSMKSSTALLKLKRQKGDSQTSYEKAVEKTLQSLTEAVNASQCEAQRKKDDLRSSGMTFVDKPEMMLQRKLENLQAKKNEYQRLVRLLDSVNTAQYINDKLFDSSDAKRTTFMDKPYDEVQVILTSFLEKRAKGSEKP